MAKGERAWVSHHIGDLSNYETLRSFTEGVEHFERLFAVEPELVVHDLHPEYLSTKFALELDGLEAVGVQHHHAHLASCLAEHRIDGPAVGAIFDGTGYGLDGTVWGGEVLIGDAAGFERFGHLHPVRMPGGERAIAQPWRMACSWLLETLGPEPPLPPRLAGRIDPAEWTKVAELAASGLASPVTTSAGRLFDAVAAICGIRDEVNYEGQAAIELEAAADPLERTSYPLPGEEVLDAREAIRALLADLGAGVELPVVAARFHNAVASGGRAILLGGRRARGRRGGGAIGRRLPEPPRCSSAPPSCSKGRASGCFSRGCFPPTMGVSPTGRRRWRQAAAERDGPVSRGPARLRPGLPPGGGGCLPPFDRDADPVVFGQQV